MRNPLTLLAILTLLFFPSLGIAEKWEKFYQKEGVELFRATKKASGLIPFKAKATIDAPFNDVLKILTNYRHKHHWAPKLKTVKRHKRLNSNTFIFSEYYETPWPATDREFLLLGEIVFKNPKHAVMSAKSVKRPYADRNHIQCDVSFLDFQVVGKTPEKTRITFEFLGDMRGWMPAWLINIIQKKWPLRFLESLRDELNNGSIHASKIYKNLNRDYTTHNYFQQI